MSYWRFAAMIATSTLVPSTLSRSGNVQPSIAPGAQRPRRE